MTCKILTVDKILGISFYKLGLVVAKHPGYFLLIPIFITIICITGYQRIHFEMDSEYLFSPENGPAKTERSIIEYNFPVDYNNRFNPLRITRPGRFGRLLVMSKDGGNVLSVKIWQELKILDDIIKNITVVMPGKDEPAYRYKDLCAKWLGECFENDVVNMRNLMPFVEKKQLNLTFPAMFNPLSWDIHVFSVSFGGVQRDENDIVLSASCIHLVYFLNSASEIQDKRASVWEEEFLKTVQEVETNKTFQYISVSRFASRTLDNELEKSTRSVVPYFGTTFVIMAVFSVITCMMTDWVRSKPMLGLLGNVSAAMGTVAAFGFCIYCGVDFIGINFVSPFLMCSIGIDDTFVMLAAWRRTPITMDVPERLAHTLSESAVSITITSLTDIISMLIGQTSPFPAIKIFCIYSGLAVLFIFFWHITFFAACVALYGYVEQNNAHNVTCLPVLPKSQSHGKCFLYKMFCSGGINPHEPDNKEDNPENAVMLWCRDSLGWLLTQWPCKVLILVIFFAYLCGAYYGTINIQEGLQRSKLSKSDSYSIEFYQREDKYFREFPYRIQVVINGEINYWERSIQQQIENLTRTFEMSPYIAPALYTESWLRSFASYVNRNENNLNISVNNQESFIKTLKYLWLYDTNPFSLDVKFNEDGTKIVASRIIIQAVNISGTHIEANMVRDLRRIANRSPLNVTVFHPYFVFFDQFELVKPTCIQSLVVGGITMMIISFIFIPNVLCSIWIAISILSIEFGVVGYMSLWNINLDSISMVNLIMCIGFSIDFTAHICYAYISCKTTATSSQKVKDSLYSLGLPIFQGALSTILGVSTLLLADSYIFAIFCKMIILVVTFGALHGLLLLPVLLSLFSTGNSGNSSCCSGTRTRTSTKAAPRKAPCSGIDIEKVVFHHPYFQNGVGGNQPPLLQPYSPLPEPMIMTKTAAAATDRYPNKVKQYGVPLHGMVPPSSSFTYLHRPDDGNFMQMKHSTAADRSEHNKDLGLGTSEDSSESSMKTQSQQQQLKKLQKEQDRLQKQKYIEGWCSSKLAAAPSHSQHGGKFNEFSTSKFNSLDVSSLDYIIAAPDLSQFYLQSPTSPPPPPFYGNSSAGLNKLIRNHVVK